MSTYPEFTLAFYMPDGNAYYERGQTLQTMHETIKHYESNYGLESIELWQDDDAHQIILFETPEEDE